MASWGGKKSTNIWDSPIASLKLSACGKKQNAIDVKVFLEGSKCGGEDYEWQANC
jgi:hypothetical protein